MMLEKDYPFHGGLSPPTKHLPILFKPTLNATRAVAIAVSNSKV